VTPNKEKTEGGRTRDSFNMLGKKNQKEEGNDRPGGTTRSVSPIFTVIKKMGRLLLVARGEEKKGGGTESKGGTIEGGLLLLTRYVCDYPHLPFVIAEDSMHAINGKKRERV